MNGAEKIAEFSKASFSPAWGSSKMMAFKRFTDIFISAITIIVLSPLLLALAVAVKLTSSGPVFYPWKVVGKDGKPFTGYKFRSMIRNADELKAPLEALNEMSGPVFKLTNDPRVTKVGSWMRRYSLDELPQ